MMRFEWLQKEVPARCPICSEEGGKRAVLATDHVLLGHPRVTLRRCPACGGAFLQDLTPPDYENVLSEMLDYYVEQGAGIDLMVAPLLRLPPGSVRRCLEVGCSFGFALDFGRSAFGWEVLGVDPSPLAAAGSAALGVPLSRSYFSAGLDLGPEPFDLVLCSEILEHLAEPHSLLAAIRERLSPQGLLVLSTPNLAIVREETEEGALGRALSPGLHLVLYDRGSLSLALAKAGFSDVRIEESPETLRAFAACSPEALARLQPAAFLLERGSAARTVLRDYYAARAAAAPPASSLACGFAYRHFKELVNAGLYEEAAASRVRLARVYQDRFGLPLARPAALEARLRRREADGQTVPFNATGALFFSGILELNSLGRPDRAAEYFAAAIAAGNAMQSGLCPTGLHDGETEELLRQSRKHLPMALAATEPDRAVREVEALASPTAGEYGTLPPELLAEACAQTFVRLVNAGAYDAAERMAPQISRQIDLRALEERGEESPGALDPLFCLGMLALHRGRPGEAAEQFGTVRRVAARHAKPERADLLSSACHHEALSLQRAGKEAPAPAIPAIRTAYMLDAFWCDPHGLYLRGWVHAYKHRVRALKVEAAGRSARVDAFSDRPDLIPFYPEHEHVRHGGFAVYLACPPGHPVTLTVETDGGLASFPLPLPEGPLPAWPEALEDGEDGEEISPTLRRFFELANARGGRLLQIGARTPHGVEPMPPRHLLRERVIGLDIHPGLGVDVVGDAHGLSRFLRERSVDGVLSASVLEHLQAPWLLAAEINRVLKPGGLVYHQAPGAWPAHAQPNDFWRISAEGLSVLFGPGSGFEILEARDSGPAAIIPGPAWRARYLDMPTVPAFATSEILARKVEDIQTGAVAWPLAAGESEARSRRYPVSGLRPTSPGGAS
jgi:SAM-dependent methyltransferase